MKSVHPFNISHQNWLIFLLRAEMTFGWVVHGASCLLGESSLGRVIYGVSCLWGKLSMERVLQGVSFLRVDFSMGQVFHGASCLWGNLSIFELSKGRVVQWGSCNATRCYGARCRGANCSGIIGTVQGVLIEHGQWVAHARVFCYSIINNGNLRLHKALVNISFF
jgi:hypothetical protein